MMSEWISVEDRLPEVGEECLCYTEDKVIYNTGVFLCTYSGYYFYTKEEGMTMSIHEKDRDWAALVLKWMPFEPPESEE